MRRDSRLHGRHSTEKPEPDTLWELCDGHGETALLLTLEYLAIKRQIRNEQALARRDELVA